MTRKCVILQPSYIPWRGYFHQIREADIFVFYDDVAFDIRGWRNRNRIRGPNGTFWLTIPVKSKGLRSEGVRINEVEIDWSRDWTRKHWRSLVGSYAGAPFFEDYRELLESMYRRRDRLLVELLIDSTQKLARNLGILDTRFIRSSSMSVSGSRSGRLLAIVQQLGADRYLTGPSAKNYLDEDLFRSAGVEIEYFRYDYPPYEQRFAGFDSQVSILDLLFMTGPDAPRYIWAKCPETPSYPLG